MSSPVFMVLDTLAAGRNVGPGNVVLDLTTVMPPGGAARFMTFICGGDFEGSIAVQASEDGATWVAIAQFTIARGDSGFLDPKSVEAIVRYLRLFSSAQIRSETTVTFGAFNFIATIEGSVGGVPVPVSGTVSVVEPVGIEGTAGGVPVEIQGVAGGVAVDVSGAVLTAIDDKLDITNAEFNGTSLLTPGGGVSISDTAEHPISTAVAAQFGYLEQIEAICIGSGTVVGTWAFRLQIGGAVILTLQKGVGPSSVGTNFIWRFPKPWKTGLVNESFTIQGSSALMGTWVFMVNGYTLTF